LLSCFCFIFFLKKTFLLNKNVYLYFKCLFLFITLTRSAITTTHLPANISEEVIKDNVTSNFYLSKFASAILNLTLPYATGQCSANGSSNFYIKPICVSNKMVNVTYYKDNTCKNVTSHMLVNDTSLFRCNASDNYVAINVNAGSTCPGIYRLALAINYCHFTGAQHATILCQKNSFQYVYYNNSKCSNTAQTLNSIQTKCGLIFTVDDINFYGNISQCVNYLTNTTNYSKNTTNYTKSTTIKPIITSTNFTNNATSSTTKHSSTTTKSAANNSTTYKNTHHHGRMIPGIPTIQTRSGVSSILNFNFNNIIFIILISLISNILF